MVECSIGNSLECPIFFKTSIVIFSFIIKIFLKNQLMTMFIQQDIQYVEFTKGIFCSVIRINDYKFDREENKITIILK